MNLTIRPTARFLVLYILATPLLWSQVVGASLSGTVRDDTGAALPGATVSVKNSETGAQRQLVTDEAGRYSAPSVAIGRYQVSADKAGFTTQRKTGIDLVVGQTTVVDLTLSVGEIKQVLTVEANASPVNLSIHFRTPGQGASAQRPQLRPTRHPEPGNRELYRGTVGWSRHLEFLGGQHVCHLRTTASGKPVSAEWR